MEVMARGSKSLGTDERVDEIGCQQQRKNGTGGIFEAHARSSEMIAGPDVGDGQAEERDGDQDVDAVHEGPPLPHGAAADRYCTGRASGVFAGWSRRHLYRPIADCSFKRGGSLHFAMSGGR